jgi:hypothetical protein
MDGQRIDQALSRLAAAIDRAETAVHALHDVATVPADEHSGLQLRHTRLKESVAQSLRQLDEVLAGLPQ